MTKDMTLWGRMAACLVAGIVVVPSAAWAAGDARASSLDRELRAALRDGPPGGKPIGRNQIGWAKQGVTMTVAARGRKKPPSFRRCPRLHVCLWQDRNAAGRRIQFKEYGTYRLRAWGMTGDKGASSFYNHQCCGARATLIGPNFRTNLRTWGNISRDENDRATRVRLFP